MLDLLLPPRCALCGVAGTALCGSCATSLPAAIELSPPPGIECCWSLLTYTGPTRDLLAALKFRNHRDAVGLLGSAMADLVDRPVGVVTWAPTSARRRRARGFDQAQLLARAVARRLGLPLRALLGRIDGGPQTGRGRAERLDAVTFTPSRRRLDGASVLVVDDVRTTGATLCAASDALLGAGAARTAALTLAVRP